MDGVATMMKLDPGVKAKWVEALRSGKYKQGRYNLHYKDAYCCLGVLCEVAVAEGVVTSAKRQLESYHTCEEVGYTAELYTLLPPPEVITWAGLSSRNGVFGTRDRLFSLASMNDAGLPFVRIAEAIEDHSDFL